MNVLIVVPRWAYRPYDYYAFPLGLAYISSAVKKNGHRVSILNLNHRGGEVTALIHEAIQSSDAQVACTGGLSIHFSLFKTIIQAFQTSPKKVLSVLGGGIITADPELIFKTLGLDFGVIGEGEDTIVELLAAIEKNTPIGSVDGIIYRNESHEIIKTKDRAAISNLNGRPWPDYEGMQVDEHIESQLALDENYLHMHDKPRMLTMISSRSCPYQCSFCFHPIGNRYRERSLDDFFGELDFIVKKYRLNCVMVLDELFAAKHERMDEFCRRIKPYGITWIVQLRVDIVSEDILQKMKDAGCVFISFGIESMSDAVLTSMRKKINRDQIEKALDLAFRIGVGIQGNLIFGDGAETRETIEESLLWWADHRDYQINLSAIFAYPGTKLYQDAIGKGKIPDPIAFLENNCPPVNVTALDDPYFSELIRVIGVLNEMVTVSAISGVRNVVLQNGRSPLRNDMLVSFDTTCPHCSAELKYKNIPLGQNPMGRFTARMACKRCNHRFDTPLSLIVSRAENPHLAGMVAEAEQLMGSGQLQEAISRANAVLHTNPVHERALVVCGHVLLKAGQPMDATRCFSLASRINPLRADIHGWIASALAASGHYFFAMLHMQQASYIKKIAEDPARAHILQLFKIFSN